MNNLNLLIEKICTNPETVTFEEVIKVIENSYLYTPTLFTNGKDKELVSNNAGENEGSCKIFAFAKLHNLNEIQTLNCFGEYYRNDVLQHPESDNHANIRAFIKHGWQHIKFTGSALQASA